jgi:hypothetical protein
MLNREAGLLVEEGALEQAERECAGDDKARAAARESIETMVPENNTP